MTPTVYIKDDRDQRVLLFDERQAGRSLEDAPAVKTTTEALGAGSWHRALSKEEIIIYGLSPFVMIGTLLGLKHYAGGAIHPVLQAAAALGVTWGVAWPGRWALRRARAQHVRTALLQSGRCAACGYALSMLQAEADGCVVCPECSAAWKRGETS